MCCEGEGMHPVGNEVRPSEKLCHGPTSNVSSLKRMDDEQASGKRRPGGAVAADAWLLRGAEHPESLGQLWRAVWDCRTPELFSDQGGTAQEPLSLQRRRVRPCLLLPSPPLLLPLLNASSWSRGNL